jgi:hypothetical protein
MSKLTLLAVLGLIYIGVVRLTAVAINTLLVTTTLPLSTRVKDGTVLMLYSRVHPAGVKSWLSRSV